MSGLLYHLTSHTFSSFLIEFTEHEHKEFSRFPPSTHLSNKYFWWEIFRNWKNSVSGGGIRNARGVLEGSYREHGRGLPLLDLSLLYFRLVWGVRSPFPTDTVDIAESASAIGLSGAELPLGNAFMVPLHYGISGPEFHRQLKKF